MGFSEDSTLVPPEGGGGGGGGGGTLVPPVWGKHRCTGGQAMLQL